MGRAGTTTGTTQAAAQPPQQGEPAAASVTVPVAISAPSASNCSSRGDIVLLLCSRQATLALRLWGFRDNGAAAPARGLSAPGRRSSGKWLIVGGTGEGPIHRRSGFQR